MLGGGSNIVSLVERWQPERWYRSEKKFEDDLAAYLRDNTGRQTKVRTQGRSNIDILVDDHIGIEIKRKLTPSKVDRLMGQLDRYEFSTAIVPVCGASENAWEELVDRTRQSTMGFADQQEVIPIRKEKNDPQTGNRGGQDPFGAGGGLF